MSYALLWVETLAAELLWLALMAGLLGRTRSFRHTLTAVAALAGFLPAALLMFFATALTMILVENNWLGYTVSLGAAYWLGAIVILLLARRREPGTQPSSAQWRLGPLTAAFLAALAVETMTVSVMDLSLRAYAATLRIEAGAMYLAAQPPSVVDSDNAAPIYTQAFVRLSNDLGSRFVHWDERSDDPLNLKDPELLAFLHRQVRTFALLQQADRLRVCRMEGDLQTPTLSELTEDLNTVRSLADLLCLDARVKMAAGQYAGNDIRMMFHLSRHVGQNPVLIAGIIALAVDTKAVQAMPEFLDHVSGSSELNAFADFDELTPPRKIMQSALKGEEALGLAAFSSMAGGLNLVPGPEAEVPGMVSNELSPAMGTLYGIFLLPDELEAYTRLMMRTQQALLLPYHLAKTRYADLLDAGDSARHGILTGLLVPSFGRIGRTVARSDANDELARVALAATRYRLDHHKLPDKLDDLLPDYLDEHPWDPFDSGELRLVVKPGEWILYSIGPDEVDDGGTPETTDTRTRETKGDITFILHPSAAWGREPPPQPSP